MFTPGLRGCGYKTVSGRHEWLSRDPLAEEVGLNLYEYVGDDPINSIAVSYTHLDVYKRQNPASEVELPRMEKRLPQAVLTLPEVERLLAVPDVTDPLGIRDRKMCIRDSFVERAAEETGLTADLLKRDLGKPVSYTHLDVYKRQPVNGSVLNGP